MKKATLIIAALILLPGLGRAEEGLMDSDGTPVGSSPVPQDPPLLLASNPVRQLPGMSPARSLPEALISDLTNFPNPFDSRKAGPEGQTTISYQLIKDARVEIQIYDLLGHKVRGWDLPAGTSGGRQGINNVAWDGTNEMGRKVAKGGYLAEIVIETPETTVTALRKIGVIH